MPEEFLATLLHMMKSQATPEGEEWFERTLTALQSPLSESKLLAAYTAAQRHLGKGLADTGRVALLLHVARTAADAFPKLALACYESGDSSEQASWLRGLSVLPGCERFLATAIDACRTNILPQFEALACENPYPSRYFPELNFNQMVLKAAFNGVSLSRIVGIESRFNSELSRMANDFVSEREAAGRDVPVDIWLGIAPKVETSELARVQRYLKHENPQHRHWAGIGLSHRKD